MNFNYSFILTIILFTFFDFSWIFLNFNYYMTLCKKIQKEPFYFKFFPIIPAYIILHLAIYIYLKFVLYEIKNSKYNKYLITIIYGLLFGLIIYGTYSLTSCIYYKNYTYYDVFKDTLWGMILFALSGLIFINLYKNNL